ncbi:hypothetical protein ACP4OV_020496 [Aristida adscensionis]
MDQGRKVRPTTGPSVIVIDEDKHHASTTRSMFSKLNFHALVYTSPVKALNFLEGNAQVVDFILVAMDMEEMHGLRFLDTVREMHKNLQVISGVMTTETTLDTMKRCVELGARFLVKKPLDTNAVNNIWQHLDLKLTRMEKINNLFQGIGGRTLTANSSSEEALLNSRNKRGNGSKHLIWTPFLQRKFLRALELLGDAATPKKIEMIMNISSIDRRHISAHLQKHRKRIEKELHDNNAVKECSKQVAPKSSEPLKTCETGPSTCQYNPKPPAARTDEEISCGQIERFTLKETQSHEVYAVMRRALQHGTTFEESRLCNDKSGAEEEKGEVDMSQDGNSQDGVTFTFFDVKPVFRTHNIDNMEKVMNVGDPDKLSTRDDQAGVMKLVTYSDSEDDEL